jgi:hypothetical protein
MDAQQEGYGLEESVSFHPHVERLGLRVVPSEQPEGVPSRRERAVAALLGDGCAKVRKLFENSQKTALFCR